MRSSRVVRASGCQCLCRNSWVQSQHPPTQWNLRGGRWSSVEQRTLKEKIPKKSPLKKIWKEIVSLKSNDGFDLIKKYVISNISNLPLFAEMKTAKRYMQKFM